MRRRLDRTTLGAGPWHPHHGLPPKGYTRSDRRIRDDVCDLLWADPALDCTGITVHADLGVVTLRGTVPNHRQVRLAEWDAAEVLGVCDVVNALRIAASQEPSAA